MASSFGFDRAELFGTLLETALFGPAILLGARTIQLLSRKEDQSNIIFRVTAYVMVIISILHLSVDWHRLKVAFIDIQSLEERVIFLNNLKDWSYVFKDGVYIIQTIIGDAILNYRCYLVWSSHKWLGIIPSILYICTFVTGIGGIVLTAKSESLFDGLLSHFITAFLISTVVTTVLATGLILVRLWLFRANSVFTNSRTTTSTIRFIPIILYLAESGALYTSVVIVVFATFWVGSAATIIFVNSLASLIVILFCAVLMQIYHQRESESTGRPTLSTLRVAPNPRKRNQADTFNTDVSINLSQFELENQANVEPNLNTKNSHTSSATATYGMV